MPEASLQGWSLLRATPCLKRRVLDGQMRAEPLPVVLGSAPILEEFWVSRKVHQISESLQAERLSCIRS